MPTAQQINDWLDSIDAWKQNAESWADDAKDAINANDDIGSNPPTPPPPPPGTSYHS